MTAMTMTPRLRKFMFLAHVTASIGWLGSVVAYLALAVSGLAGKDVVLARSAYVSMELIGWGVIVPFSLASLPTVLVQSFGTVVALFRPYYITTNFLPPPVSSFIFLLPLTLLLH